MRIVMMTLILLATAALAPTDSRSAPCPRPTEPATVESLAWLSGTWVGVQGKTEMEEVWMAPKGGAMIGMHRDVTAGKMTSFEYLRIVSRDDKIAYIASPGGGPSTPFLLKESGEKKVVFENSKHDFPKRIIYWIDKDEALHAKIEGDADSKEPAMEWTWRRPEAPKAK